MIELLEVSKEYDGKKAVDNISLKINEGEITVLIGPSGCGKTTTLRMINRLISPTDGKVNINGKDIQGLNPEKLRRNIGYVIQNVGLFPHMSVSKNISTVPRLLKWPKDKCETRVVELLDMIGLNPEEYKGKYPYQLSGGEAQRVGVARALAADPQILLMDEPFGAVDPLNRDILQGEFIKIQKKLQKTVIFVTHDLDEAIRMADRIVVMKDGKIVQYDTPENILASPADKFVRDFAGSNRALKRLSRFAVNDFFHGVNPIGQMSEITASVIVRLAESHFLWVVDGNGILTGWVQSEDIKDGKTILDVMSREDIDDIGIDRDSTLKEALSRMLSQGIEVVPVVDSKGVLVGEISFNEIHKWSSGEM